MPVVACLQDVWLCERDEVVPWRMGVDGRRPGHHARRLVDSEGHRQRRLHNELLQQLLVGDLQRPEVLHRNAPGQLQGGWVEHGHGPLEELRVGALGEQRCLPDAALVPARVPVRVLRVPDLEGVVPLGHGVGRRGHAAVPRCDVDAIDPELQVVPRHGAGAPDETEVGLGADGNAHRPLDAGGGAVGTDVCAA